jgi:hypothetical protein
MITAVTNRYVFVVHENQLSDASKIAKNASGKYLYSKLKHTFQSVHRQINKWKLVLSI